MLLQSLVLKVLGCWHHTCVCLTYMESASRNSLLMVFISFIEMGTELLFNLKVDGFWSWHSRDTDLTSKCNGRGRIAEGLLKSLFFLYEIQQENWARRWKNIHMKFYLWKLEVYVYVIAFYKTLKTLKDFLFSHISWTSQDIRNWVSLNSCLNIPGGLWWLR